MTFDLTKFVIDWCLLVFTHRAFGGWLTPIGWVVAIPLALIIIHTTAKFKELYLSKGVDEK